MSTIPRRAHLDRYTSGETAIAKAIEAVEAMGADERLTRAVVLLVEAKDRVADFVDGVPLKMVESVQLGPCPSCKLGVPEIQGKQPAGTALLAFRVLCPTCGAGHNDPLRATLADAVDVWKAKS